MNITFSEVLPLKANRDLIFEKIAMPHRSALYNYALKVMKNTEDAEDMVQETYFRAYKFFHHFELGTNCKAWLFKILKNVFINHYQKQNREPEKLEYEDVQNFYERIKPEEIATSHSEYEELDLRMIGDKLSNALSALPSEFRTVILLGDVENYTYEEIADFVNCPIGTVRSRLHRARKMLFTRLHTHRSGKSVLAA